LIPPQIGNFLSFVKTFKKIGELKIPNNKFFLICEDDIQFYDNAVKIFNDLINEKNLKDIDLNLPTIFRCVRGGHDRSKYKKIILERQTLSTQGYRYLMSNPCFAVNKAYADLFMKTFKKINTTSDHFIHVRMIKLNP
jgi:GR25 family glycosyltransferase involved in LPS biosynthesis